jgi:pimeloyl-ACP methyl ester carboxylesterase
VQRLWGSIMRSSGRASDNGQANSPAPAIRRAFLSRPPPVSSHPGSRARHLATMALLAFVALSAAAAKSSAEAKRVTLGVESLSVLSIEGLRARKYGAVLHRESELKPYAPDRAATSRSYVVSYVSDGLREYARLDVPLSPMPSSGFPVAVFLHGWVGERDAPRLDFTFDHSEYGRLINRFTSAGFVVLAPGFRGHGSVGGRVADGLEFLSTWDNGSYISPAFYAIDVLNLLDGIPSIEAQPGERWGLPRGKRIRIDRHHIGVIGHSQGGDVALMVAAVCGVGTPLHLPVTAASIWSGTFADRLVQRAVYHPMETTRDAYLSGDGSWTSISTGRDGQINADFIFGFPGDWGAHESAFPEFDDDETRSQRTVALAIEERTAEMYQTLSRQVSDLRGVTYRMSRDATGRTVVVDDQRVVDALRRVGAFRTPEWLTVPLALHHSDRDFYSWSAWNSDLCQRVNDAGGNCVAREYIGNTHALGVSTARWFSPLGSQPGFDAAVRDDIALFLR